MTEKRANAEFSEFCAEFAAMLVTGAVRSLAVNGTMEPVYDFLNLLVKNSVIEEDAKAAIEYILDGAIQAMEAKVEAKK